MNQREGYRLGGSKMGDRIQFIRFWGIYTNFPMWVSPAFAVASSCVKHGISIDVIEYGYRY